MTKILIIAIVIFGLTGAIYRLIFYFALRSEKKPNVLPGPDRPLITIIIVVKNEVTNLRALPLILKQDYDNIEVIIADDFSQDPIEIFLRNTYPDEKRLNYFRVKTNRPGKRQAIYESVFRASGQWLLFTDADCRPASDSWVYEMIHIALHFNKPIILGYSPSRSNGALLEDWILFEHWLTGLQYLSMARLGQPYMGVGRNYLIKKEFYPAHLHLREYNIAGGDDDLIINAVSDSENTDICISSNAFVFTAPAQSIKNYLNQKNRHFSSSVYYKKHHIVLLSIFSLSHTFFYILIISLIFYNPAAAIIIYLFRMIFILFLSQLLKKILPARISLWRIILFDLILAAYYLYFSFSFLLPNRSKWK